MKTFVALALLVLYSRAPGSAVERHEEILKIGPALSFGSYGDLSEVDGLLAGGLPGIELAVRCAKRLEIWGAYKFSKTEYRMGHGSDRIFRIDAFAGGLRWKPVRLKNGEPFVGVGLNGYFFSDDAFTPFILPVKSAFGPYVQGGGYLRLFRFLQVQLSARYNLVPHTEKWTTPNGTYHYRTDFSGLELSAGLLFCISGRQQVGVQ
jgi:hypothetical protein